MRDLTPEVPIKSLDEARPRLDCAGTWVLKYAPDEARTTVRDEPDHQMLASLTGQDQVALQLLLGQLAEHWSLEGLTTLLYGIPKLIRGLPIDAPPTSELKVAQRAWFVLLYRLLIGKDTGRGCRPCCSPSAGKSAHAPWRLSPAIQAGLLLTGALEWESAPDLER